MAVNLKSYYSMNLATGEYECEVSVNGKKCRKSFNDQSNMCKHVKRHFPDLSAKQNAARRATPSYKYLNDKQKLESLENSLSLQLKKRKREFGPQSPVPFNSQKDGPLPFDSDESKEDFDILMSQPTRKNRRWVYFLLLLPTEALANVWNYVKKASETGQPIPVYVGKNSLQSGPPAYHTKPGSTIDTYCVKHKLTPVHVHDIDCGHDKSLQELTECWFQCFLQYSSLYKPSGAQFIIVNQKIEEMAAREHNMTHEEFSTAKSAAKRQLPLFCAPDCELSHNKNKLRFYPCLHATQAPSIIKLNDPAEDEVSSPKAGPSKQGRLDNFFTTDKLN